MQINAEKLLTTRSRRMMLSWLAPWVYLAVIGVLYSAIGRRRPQARAWVRSFLNLWLAITLALTVLGIAGEVAYRWRWLALGAWFVTVVAIVITIVHAWRWSPEAPPSRFEDLVRDDIDNER